MKWIRYGMGILLLTLLSECAKKYFDPNLLENNKGKVQLNSQIKCYDDSNSFYLLTFYKTIEKNLGEDFSYEGVNSYKNDSLAANSVEGDSSIVQYLALYFFKDGGVVYHTKYSVSEHEKYVPLELSAMGDLYKWDSVTKKQDKIGYAVHRPLMQGYQLNKVDERRVATVLDGSASVATSPKAEQYDAKARQYFNRAIGVAELAATENRTNQDTTLVKLFLERRGGKSPIFMIGKHLPASKGRREAILIEQLFFEKEINSSSGRFTNALLDKTFDFGTVTDTTKALLWFRWRNKDEFQGNRPPNLKR